MVLSPCGSDRDGEIVHGEKLQIARIVPNVPIAARRSNIRAARGDGRAFVKRSMLVSISLLSIAIDADL
jgi:hypothetical protein